MTVRRAALALFGLLSTAGASGQHGDDVVSLVQRGRDEPTGATADQLSALKEELLRKTRELEAVKSSASNAAPAAVSPSSHKRPVRISAEMNEEELKQALKKTRLKKRMERERKQEERRMLREKQAQAKEAERPALEAQKEEERRQRDTWEEEQLKRDLEAERRDRESRKPDEGAEEEDDEGEEGEEGEVAAKKRNLTAVKLKLARLKNWTVQTYSQGKDKIGKVIENLPNATVLWESKRRTKEEGLLKYAERQQKMAEERYAVDHAPPPLNDTAKFELRQTRKMAAIQRWKEKHVTAEEI